MYCEKNSICPKIEEVNELTLEDFDINSLDGLNLNLETSFFYLNDYHKLIFFYQSETNST